MKSICARFEMRGNDALFPSEISHDDAPNIHFSYCGRWPRARVLYAVQPPFHKALLSGKTQHAAWRSKPSFYAVSTQDRTINPDLQHFMAKRMGATTIEVNSSHVSLMSHPQEIAALIVQAAGRR